MQRLRAAAEGKALALDQRLQLRRVSDVSRCARGLRLTVASDAGPTRGNIQPIDGGSSPRSIPDEQAGPSEQMPGQRRAILVSTCIGEACIPMQSLLLHYETL